MLIERDLVQQRRQHRRVADIAGRDLDGPDLQRFLINPYVYLAPNPAFRAAMLASVPFAFTLGFDACTIDQQVQGPVSPR